MVTKNPKSTIDTVKLERNEHKHAAAAVASVMSNSVRPHRQQPSRLPGPWDSPGKNTGVGCHFLLQRMKVKSESEVAQSCPTLSDPMDCSPPGSKPQGKTQKIRINKQRRAKKNPNNNNKKTGKQVTKW